MPPVQLAGLVAARLAIPANQANRLRAANASQEVRPAANANQEVGPRAGRVTRELRRPVADVKLVG
uniref:Uncharacterized protein n=1 Tax=Candidatus Desulfatibia profunda TaxID=2841695 RepID=A0A8J6NL78_9BACT|nr:hypothetical protein [Candidatus Desulfatibia profunda]